MRKVCLCLALVASILSFTSRSAAADTVRIGFDVNVLAAHGALEEIFGTPIHVGDILHGSFSCDPAVPDHNPDPLYGSYLPLGNVSIGQGSDIILPLQGAIVIDNAWGVGYTTDYFAAVSEYANLPGFSQALAIAEFYGPPTASDNDALPKTAAAFRAMYFSHGLFQFSANKNGVEPPWDDTTHAFTGTIRFSDTDPAAVPEPASLLLMATGAIFLGRHVTRRDS